MFKYFNSILNLFTEHIPYNYAYSVYLTTFILLLFMLWYFYTVIRYIAYILVVYLSCFFVCFIYL